MQSRLGDSIMYRDRRYTLVAVAVVAPLLLLPRQIAQSAALPKAQLPARSSNIIPRAEMSLERIRDWTRANPQSAEEVLRQNRLFVFFRIVGLSDDREPKDTQGPPHDQQAVGAQGVPLTPGRSIAVDNTLRVYGTPFFI